MSRLEENLQAHRVESNCKLVESLMKKGVVASEDLIALFAAVNPKAFLYLPNNSTRLTLVKDDLINDLSELGVDLPNVSSLIGLEGERAVNRLEPVDMTEAELKLYLSPYFKDSRTRDWVIEAFFSEDGYRLDNMDFRDTLRKIDAVINPPEAEPRSNTYTLGKDQIDIRLKHREKAEFSTEEPSVIAFPERSKIEPKDVLDTPLLNESALKQKYGEVSEAELLKFAQSAFSFCVVQLAKMPENQMWFSGVNTNLTIPSRLKDRLNLADSVGYGYGLMPYEELLKPCLAAVISYYYPGLVCAESLERAKSLPKAVLPMNVKVGEGNISAGSMVVLENIPLEMAEEVHKPVVFSMNRKVAAHYGFDNGVKVYCSTEEAERLWQLADEEPVNYTIENKPVEISAKMFRRIFHRGELPSQEDLGKSVLIKSDKWD